MIEIQNLSVGYSGKPLVRDMNITLEPGEVLAIIGPNGSGKSTLIKTILRQLKPVSGQITVDGEDIQSLALKAFSKKVSAVLTGRITTEYMSGYDVVSQGRYPYETAPLHHSRDDVKAVEEALSFLNISHLGGQDFSTMSDGQKQLVMIARALAQDTPVMILDEPENHLDIRYKLGVLSALKEMSEKKSKTVVMSLHDISYAKAVADRLLLINANHDHRLIDAAELDSKTAEELFSIDRDIIYSGFRDIKIV